MKNSFHLTAIVSWFLGILILTLGILNLLLIHPVPGGIYILLALLFFPPVKNFYGRKLGLKVPFPALVVLAIIIFWFTLGISDLGEMYGF